MSLYAIIVLSIGIAICVYGIISKVIEITAKKTVETYLHRNDTMHKTV